MGIFKIPKTVNTVLDGKIVRIKIDKIHTLDKLADEFHMDEDVKNRIAEDMKIHGFNPAHPIHVFIYEGQIIIIDGHTRHAAALLAGLSFVYVQFHNISTLEEALIISRKEQGNRRNLTESEMLKLVNKMMNSEHLPVKEISKRLNKSPRQIFKIAYINKNSTQEQLEELDNKKTTINKLYNNLKEQDEKVQEKIEKKIKHDEKIASFVDSDKLENFSDKSVDIFVEKAKSKTKPKITNTSCKEIFILGINYALSESLKGIPSKDILENDFVKNLAPNETLSTLKVKLYNERED